MNAQWQATLPCDHARSQRSFSSLRGLPVAESLRDSEPANFNLSADITSNEYATEISNLGEIRLRDRTTRPSVGCVARCTTVSRAIFSKLRRFQVGDHLVDNWNQACMDDLFAFRVHRVIPTDRVR